MGRDRCTWSGRESYSVGVPRQCRASRLQQCERHRSVAPMQDGTKRCATVRDAWSVAASQRSKREHLSVVGRASTSEYVSSPTKKSMGSFFVLRVAGATTLGRSVACRTFQRYRIKFKLNSFLFEREC